MTQRINTWTRVHSFLRQWEVSRSTDSSPAANSSRDISAVYLRPLRYYVYVRKGNLQLVCVLEMSLFGKTWTWPNTYCFRSFFSFSLPEIYERFVRLCVGKRGHLSDAVRKIEGRGQVFHWFSLIVAHSTRFLRPDAYEWYARGAFVRCLVKVDEPKGGSEFELKYVPERAWRVCVKPPSSSAIIQAEECTRKATS